MHLPLIDTNHFETDARLAFSTRAPAAAESYSLDSQFFTLLQSKLETPENSVLQSLSAIEIPDGTAMGTEISTGGPLDKEVYSKGALDADFTKPKRLEESAHKGAQSDSSALDDRRQDAAIQSDARSIGERIGGEAADRALAADSATRSGKSQSVGRKSASNADRPRDDTAASAHQTKRTHPKRSSLVELSGVLNQLGEAARGGDAQRVDQGNRKDGPGKEKNSGNAITFHRNPNAHGLVRMVGAKGGSSETDLNGGLHAGKLVVVDLRSNRLSDRSVDIPDLAESGSNTRTSLLKAMAIQTRSRVMSSVEGNAGAKAELRRLGADFKDIQRRDAAESSSPETRLFARAAIQDLKEGFQSERIAGGDLGKRASVIARFKEALQNEVVRSSSIILKDHGQGELRLILKPESLGQVRIRLALNNNHIEGRIIVENSTVKEMFESNLQNLNQALQREGIASSSLEVFVSGGNERNQQKEVAVPSFSAAQEFEDTTSIQDEYLSDDWLVNITV